MLTALPNHERLIPTLCQYDLVGFQTDVDAFNFSRYLDARMRAALAQRNSFHFRDREVRVGAFPVGDRDRALRQDSRAAR